MNIFLNFAVNDLDPLTCYQSSYQTLLLESRILGDGLVRWIPEPLAETGEGCSNLFNMLVGSHQIVRQHLCSTSSAHTKNKLSLTYCIFDSKMILSFIIRSIYFITPNLPIIRISNSKVYFGAFPSGIYPDGTCSLLERNYSQ